MHFIKQVIRGAGYLKGYGEHPGNFILVIFLIVAAFIGGGFLGTSGAIFGFCLMALFIVPVYCFGAYMRAEEYDKNQEK